MTTKVSDLRPILNVAGVQPSTDKTAFATNHWTHSDKIRFVNGLPRKIGGWALSVFQEGAVAKGKMRTINSAVLGGKVVTVLGTEQKLYSYAGSVLTNITPLQTDTIAIANSLDTHYDTLANNPISTTNGSAEVQIADAEAELFKVGDTYTLSGSTAVGGVPDTEINSDQIVRGVASGVITIRVATEATSTTSGGGASVVRSSGLITVNDTAHGQASGDRVKITGAATTGGITNTQINLEFVTRNNTDDTFDIMTTGTATSSVSAGGGASTVYQVEIDAGRAQAAFGQGYGVGLYGTGLYGVSKVSTAGILPPRIWFIDRYGENVIATAGNQTGVYTWDGITLEAPVLVNNAPTSVNYAFVSNRILVTFGAGGVPNKIFASDIDNITQWTASSTNQVYEKNIEGASRLISHVSVAGLNLVFTEDKCYTFRYIGGDLVWEQKLKDASVGIIAPMARVTVNDVAYWMGNDNFYMWRGGNIEIIPANTQKDCTLLRYVFDDLSQGQKSTCFAWYNKKYNEIWFHYPSSTSDNPDRIARVCLTDYAWSMDTMDRLAAEYPDTVLNTPRLSAPSGSNSILYRHEEGFDDNGSALAWTLTGSKLDSGRDTANIVALIPDSVQIGDITAHVDTYEFPQSTTKMFNQDYTIEPTTERVPATINGRIRQYTFSGEAVGQNWQMGLWQEQLQRGASN